MGGYLGAFGVLCAIRHRRRTGEGQHIDVSQIEPGIPLTGAAVLDRAVNGRRYRRHDTPGGNRSLIPPAAPRGAYRCRGDDGFGNVEPGGTKLVRDDGHLRFVLTALESLDFQPHSAGARVGVDAV